MMTEQVPTASAAPRCLGRLMAQELTAGEIEAIGGGVTYSGISMFEVVDEAEGRVRFNYEDYED